MAGPARARVACVFPFRRSVSRACACTCAARALRGASTHQPSRLRPGDRQASRAPLPCADRGRSSPRETLQRQRPALRSPGRLGGPATALIACAGALTRTLVARGCLTRSRARAQRYPAARRCCHGGRRRTRRAWLSSRASREGSGRRSTGHGRWVV